MPSINDTLFVSGQLGLFIAYIWVPAFRTFPQSPVVKNIGFIILAVGLLVFLLSIYQLRKHISPFPSPLKQGSLITAGIYNYIRHPIYSGILIALTGHVLTSPQLGRILVTGLLTVFFFFKSRYEEKLLLNTYPGYHDYKKRTCRFFPGF